MNDSARVSAEATFERLRDDAWRRGMNDLAMAYASTLLRLRAERLERMLGRTQWFDP